MQNKNLELSSYKNETLSIDTKTKSNLSLNENRAKRVDINVLKSRIQEKQSKETRQNITIFTLFLLAFCFLGIFLAI